MKSLWRSFQWWRLNRKASFPKIKETFAWQRILLVLYYGAAQATYFSRGVKGQIESDHPLVKDYGIEPHIVESSLWFLEEQDLIEIEKGSSKNFKLTKRGFDVAMEVEKNILSERLQFGLVAFSGLLFLATFAQIAIASLQMESLQVGMLLLGVFSMIFIAMLAAFVYFTRKFYFL